MKTSDWIKRQFTTGHKLSLLEIYEVISKQMTNEQSQELIFRFLADNPEVKEVVLETLQEWTDRDLKLFGSQVFEPDHVPLPKFSAEGDG